MDLTVRDWMVIAGVLLILAVLLDAWRRINSTRYSRVKVDLAEPEEAPPRGDAELSWFRELPNGGARVIERDDLRRAAGVEREAREAQSRGEQTGGAKSSAERNVDDVTLVEGMSTRGERGESQNLDWLEDVSAVEGQPRETATDERRPAEDPEVFMLNVVSRSHQGFRGEDILHILLACDLRFGAMSFFHRHEFEAGRGAIQFSVANMLQPGVFDIDNMADISTQGLVFFLTLPGPEDMMKAFDYMLETAQAVARNLNGDVLDESRSVLTKQAMAHCRQQIRDLERRQLARAR